MKRKEVEGMALWSCHKNSEKHGKDLEKVWYQSALNRKDYRYCTYMRVFFFCNNETNQEKYIFPSFDTI